MNASHLPDILREEVSLSQIASDLRRIHSLLYEVKFKLTDYPMERDGKRDVELDRAVDMLCLGIDFLDVVTCKAENSEQTFVADRLASARTEAAGARQ